jgi:hypothetical protein
MGRVETDFARPLMTAGEVAKHLLKACTTLQEYQSFMFGSSLFGIGRDYDILIVGPSGVALSQLKAELILAGKELPLDILYMLPAEAEETDFVSREGCISLSQLAGRKVEHAQYRLATFYRWMGK